MKLNASRLIAKTVVETLMKMLNAYNFELLWINEEMVLRDINTDTNYNYTDLAREVTKESGYNLYDKSNVH